MLLSKGNHKLPSDIAIFNLPHMTTCPGATEECKRYCYANKAERLYPSAYPFRKRNFKLSQQEDFVDQVSAALRRMRVLRAVRIHESGDFYNQKYLDKWVEIAKRFPDIIFTAYTKSLHLDFTAAKKLKNFVLFASMDPTTPKYMKEANTIQHKAIVIQKGERVPRGYFECPGSCKSCDHCYKPRAKSVAFHKH